MCDGCGCDKPMAPGDENRLIPGKANGWHVHADGTVHRHDHAHGHSHQYVRNSSSWTTAKPGVRQPAPEGGEDNGEPPRL